MGYIKGECREQITLFPEILDDYVNNDNHVRFIEAFVNDLKVNSFAYSQTKSTGRPPHNPKDLLKLFIYGYLNGIRSSRKLEKETQRNVEVMWLMQKLTPDHKTIANFRKDNNKAIKQVFKEFTLKCKKLGLFGCELIAFDGSKFPAVNGNKNNFTKKKIEDKIKSIEKHIQDYFDELDRNDEKEDLYICPKNKELAFNQMVSGKNDLKYKQYRCEECYDCENKGVCTESKNGRTIKRWEKEELLEEMESRMLREKEKYKKRQSTVEPVFGIIKRSMGHYYMLMKVIRKVNTEIGLSALAYNMKRAITEIGIEINRVNGIGKAIDSINLQLQDFVLHFFGVFWCF